MSAEDLFFGPAWIDVDEHRAIPIPHQYVHGGFDGTDTRFSVYLPAAGAYNGRALHWLEGGAGGHEGPEAHSQDVLGYYLALASRLGAYLVESNQGHLGEDPGPDDPTIVTYRASAATARFARQLARRTYGAEPHHSYLFGGSGGGIRTILCLENVSGLWDGGVPFVAGDPATMIESGLPLAAAVALRLGPKLRSVVDAMEPGGSNDPYACLDDEEAAALRDLLAKGFNAHALFQYTRPSIEKLIVPGMLEAFLARDPSRVASFANGWVYEGSVVEVLTAEQIAAEGIDRHDPTAAVAEVAPGLAPPRTAVRVAPAPPPDTEFATVTTGTSSWTSLGTFSDVLLLRTLGSGDTGVSAGAEVRIDTALARAFASEQQAHSVPLRTLPVTGRFEGKMILVAATHDALVPPVAGAAYDRKVRASNSSEDWRLWWVEHSGHVGAFGPPGPPPVLATRLVPYTGVVDQALFDLVAWVENGTQPPDATAYELQDGQLVLPDTAGQRRGVQPVVRATANGGERADADRGEPVRLDVTVELPPGAGTLEEIVWDVEGSGAFATSGATIDHAFDAPGVYFPAARVTARREGVQAPLASLVNIGRVRVVVR